MSKIDSTHIPWYSINPKLYWHNLDLRGTKYLKGEVYAQRDMSFRSPDLVDTSLSSYANLLEEGMQENAGTKIRTVLPEHVS